MKEPKGPFPWHQVKRPPRDADKRQAMYRHDLEERAKLLLRLGRTPKQVKARLAAAVAWEFDLNGKPKHAGEVDKIVDAVFRRHDV
jgi:hypothetical protein